MIEICEAQKRDMSMASGALKDKVSHLAAALVQAEGRVDALSRHILQQNQPADVLHEQTPLFEAAPLATTLRLDSITTGALIRLRQKRAAHQ